MKALVEKFQVCASHFARLNDFFVAKSPEYRAMHRKMTHLASYPKMAELFYPSYKKRQMALFDVTYFLVVGRPWWVASNSPKGKADYLKFVLYFINLLCIQEHLACHNPRFRKSLLIQMKQADLEGFFQNPSDRTAYGHCKRNTKVINAQRSDPDYVVVDGLLPKSIGNATEMIVYVSLLQSNLGFPVLLQLQQRLMMKEMEIVSPDILLVTHDGKAFGIEIGQGTGQFSLRDSKIRQMNEFVSQTKLPLLTALVPLPYRCPQCNQWILFCDQVIEEFAVSGRPMDKVRRECISCPRFKDGQCLRYNLLRKNQKGRETVTLSSSLCERDPLRQEIAQGREGEEGQVDELLPALQRAGGA